ncbi:hypothetical protein HanLR1_Chr10g0357091 [Helianthus annuus]|nr:hypothetical protein HanLR1_Chr10g0357091 [Helianthus annuus]
MATPPNSPVQQAVPIQPEIQSTPPQQTIHVDEPTPTSKKAATSVHQSSSQIFPGIPSNLDPIPSLDDVGFFGEERVDGILKRVSVLEMATTESDEKLKAAVVKLKETKENMRSMEAENVVLKNELTAVKEKVLEDEQE